MNEPEDLRPIMLRRLPAPLSMQDWARTVDDYLTGKSPLDRRKAQRAEQDKQVPGGEDR